MSDPHEPLRIGIDLIMLSRVEKMYREHGDLFLKRFFTAKEASYSLGAPGLDRRIERLGGRIAAKEAVMKALGQGWPYIPWTDIEIVNQKAGGPCVSLKGKAQALMKEKNLESIQISITHDGQFAAAVAVGTTCGQHTQKL